MLNQNGYCDLHDLRRWADSHPLHEQVNAVKFILEDRSRLLDEIKDLRNQIDNLDFDLFCAEERVHELEK